MIENWFHDLRFGARMLRRNPGFTAVALLSLTIGIGAGTSIFSVLNAALFRDLPVKNPGQLVLIRKQVSREAFNLFSYPVFQTLQQNQQVLESLMASGDLWVQQARLASGQNLESLTGRVVSRNYFSVLGVRPQVGRAFDDAAEEPQLVISHAFWKRQFASDPAALGTVLNLDGVSVAVIGVMPPQFFGESAGQAPDLFVPLDQYRRISSPRVVDNARNHWLNLVGRIKPGVDMNSAGAALDTVFGQTPEYQKNGAENRELRVIAESGRHGLRTLRDRFDTPLWALMGLAALLLLIACCNVANLLLARATARQREIGIRTALGATRPRLLRQLLTEGLLLASGGGLAALWIAMFTGPALVALASDPANPLIIDCRPDWRVFCFTVTVSLAATLLFALIPALQGLRQNILPALKETPPAQTAVISRQRPGRLLVVAQVALSVALLAGAGLLVRTLSQLTGLDPGFRPDNVVLARLTFRMTPSALEKLRRLAAPIAEGLEAIPGVQAVGLSTYGGLARGHQTQEVSLPEGEAAPRSVFRLNHVSHGYFAAYGIELLGGRLFGPQDVEGSPPVVVLNQSSAKLLFGNQMPIGRRLCLDRKYNPSKASEVVGVVRDAKYTSLREEMQPLLYIPISQGGNPAIFIAARAALPMDQIVPQMRRAVQAADAETGLAEVRTLRENIESTLVQERMMARLSGIIGLLALVLAGIGIYGILAYTTARRTKELGIRLAIGAPPHSLRWMVLREATLLVAAGVAAGLPAALAAARWMRSLLYGIGPADPLTLVLTVLFLLFAGLLAAYVPAKRASKIDPLRALRFD